MKLQAPPLSLIALAGLAALNAWLLDFAIDQVAPTPTTIPSPTAQNRKQTINLDNLSNLNSTSGDQNIILEKPVFFKTRAPYVPPPPPAVVQAPPAPPPPPPPIVYPNLTVKGVVIGKIERKALLVKQNDPTGTWVREGDDILGWTLELITTAGVSLKQRDHTIELSLYAK